MQYNNRMKLLLMLTGILLFNGVIQNYAYGDSLNNSGNVVHGAKVWANNCSRCHNYRSPTEYSTKDWHLIMQHMRIQAGLTGQDARDVYAFLAEQSANTQVPISTPQINNKPVESTVSAVSRSTTKLPSISQTTSAQSGKAIYHQTCVACHGANGKGAIPGAPDFTSKNGPLSKSDEILLNHMANGFQSSGSSMAMPPKGGNTNLTNTDLRNTLTYIRQKFVH